jgi:hypothetical protein
MPSNPLHGDQTSDDGIHIVHALEYADAVARAAASGLVPADIGKVARQIDNGSFWVLSSDVGPAWASIDGGGGSPTTLASFTVGTLPAVSPAAQMIYVSDESGGAVPAFSDGTDWRRVTDRQIVT